MRCLAGATLLANAGIVTTGAAVRLTSSGLGCPTWPRCTDQSYIVTSASGLHGYVEFGNRLLTFVLTAVVVATVCGALLQRPRRRALVLLTFIQLAGIFGQAVLGGVTVLTGLNPWTVAGHFLLSMALIYGAFALWHRAGEGDGPRRLLVPPLLVWLGRGVVTVAAATLALGTVVTGSGPHSGDSAAARTGFPPELVSQVHADLVFLLLGLTVATVIAASALDAPRATRRSAALLLFAELAQGVIGYVQYFKGLPAAMVGLHVAGACLLWIAALSLLFSLRIRTA
jgi:cytochrome c oxidase assembly protein subunit 15